MTDISFYWNKATLFNISSQFDIVRNAQFSGMFYLNEEKHNFFIHKLSNSKYRDYAVMFVSLNYAVCVTWSFVPFVHLYIAKPRDVKL